MKVTAVTCDWKEDMDPGRVAAALAAVGGGRFEYEVQQAHVDSKVVVVSSHALDVGQIEALWLTGDLALEDRVFEGPFPLLLTKVVAHAAELEAEQ